MSGRGRLPRHVMEGRRRYPDIPGGPFIRGPPRPHPAALEEEFESQQVEFQRLMADHRALVEERMALHRDLQAGKDEIRHLNMIMADISAKNEAYISELIDKRMKLEAELRANEPLRLEVVQLRNEIEQLIAVRKELSANVQSLMQELAKAKSDDQQIPMLKAEIDGLQQQLINTKTASEFEQKGNYELLEQRKAIERNMASMAHEIERMRSELVNIEGRQWGAGGAYGMNLGSAEGTFTAPYGDGYNLHTGVSEKGPMHPPGSNSWGTFDKNRLPRR